LRLPVDQVQQLAERMLFRAGIPVGVFADLLKQRFAIALKRTGLKKYRALGKLRSFSQRV